MKNFVYKKITKSDREYLDALLNKNARGAEAWWNLDVYWQKKYNYTLRVQVVYDFIEKLIVPSGKGAGKEFILRDFQKDFIREIYNPLDKKNNRLVRRAILSLARKNGKTALIACLVLVHLFGPESIPNGENYSLANDRDQASLVFKYAAQMVRANNKLSQYIRIVDSTKTMIFYQNGSIYRALSAEVTTKFGLNTSFAVFDELAQAKNRDLYDALDTSMGAREEPLFIVISTQSNDPQHILSQLIDDGLSGRDPTTICHLYAVPDDADDEACFEDKKLWKLANPALGDFRSLSEMRTAAKRARRMTSFEAAFRNLYLNQRVDVQAPFIPRMEWLGCKGETNMQDKERLYLGLDLSGKTDLTALVGVTDGEKSRVICWFWKPDDTLKEHEDRDRVPYWAWKQEGFILTTPGRAIQYSYIADQLAKINSKYQIVGLAFDRYRIDDMLNAMGEIGLDAYVEGKDTGRPGFLRMVPWGQGYKDMTPAVEALEVAVLERVLIHDGHPCLTWNISNAIAVSDPAGNKKLDKSATRFRIDGAVALAMAIGLKSRDMSEIKPSVYSGLTKEAIMQRMAM
jgi:phage terminase large subunit-like protein